MRKTDFQAEYELMDVTAIVDSTPSTSSNQAFADISDLTEDVQTEDYATLEEDYFLLDGSFPEMPDVPDDEVFFSSAMSDANGDFVSDPNFTVEFTENHTSYGLTFYFVGDLPLEMVVEWYTLDNILLDRKVYEPDASAYFAQNQVENYGKIIVTFTKAKPYRYVKLRFVEYGTRWVVGIDGLPCENAELTEEINGEASKIPVNTLSFKVIDAENQFNLGNMDGIHRVLQQGQKCTAHEYVDGTPILLGVFYLNKSSASKNVASLECQDAKGMLDNVDFIGGAVYDGTTTAGTVIAQIMVAAGITDYSVDADTASVPLYGWLKNQTCRKALNEILFACGSLCDTSHSETFRIFRPSKTIVSNIKRGRKFSTATEQKDYISDVSVKYSVYTLDASTSQVAKGHYLPGTYTVLLSSPAANMTATGATITEQTNNYVRFTVASEGDVIISGNKYKKEDLTETASIAHVEGGATRKSKSFTNTLLDASGAMARASELLDYYKDRLGIKIKFLPEEEKPSEWCLIQNETKQYVEYVAGVEKITTDLTGGFVATAEMRGYYNVNPFFYYMPEIYGNDDIGAL